MTDFVTDMSGLDQFQSDLKNQMDEFSVKFENKMSSARSDLFEESNKYAQVTKEIKQEQDDLLNQVENINKRVSDLEKQNAEEVEELQQAKLQNEELEIQKQQYEASKNELIAKIQELNAQVQAKREELSNVAQELKLNKRLNVTELTKLESYTGLKIEGLSPDLLKFSFKNIDLNNYDRIYSFKLDLSTDYSVRETEPQLDDQVVARIQENFNYHKDMAKFLKEIRAEFGKLG